jgi:RHS repeat-associated protein
MAITGGNLQNGLVYSQLPQGATGLLLPGPLQVQVKDSQGNPVPGVRVSFTVQAGGALVIEDDPKLFATTNSAGLAQVRARTTAGSPGMVNVTAQVVGAPSVVQTFTLYLFAPQIVLTSVPQIAAYGQGFEIDFAFQGGGTPNAAFTPEIARPVVLKVAATNATLSASELLLTSSTSGSVDFVPTLASGSVTLVITDAVDGRITLQVPISVQTPDNGTLFPNPSGGTSVGRTLVYIEPTSPPPGSASLIGYPGLTMATPFTFQVRSASNVYSQTVPPSGSGTTTSVIPTTLIIDASNSGLLSMTPASPGTTKLVVNVGTPVYFTPMGVGPWGFSVICTATSLIDPSSPQTFADVSLIREYDYWVQSPTVRLAKAITPTTQADSITPGFEYILVFDGISPTIWGTPDPVTLNLLPVAGSAPTGYTVNGRPVVFQSQLEVVSGSPTLKTSGFITSRDSASTSTLTQAYVFVIPGWTLQIQTCAGIFAWTVARQPLARKAINGVESIQEAAVGTTPRAGASGTVNVRNGEFVLGRDDLNFATRYGALHFGRVYRDHLLTEGLLGPRWCFEHGAFLDLYRGLFPNCPVTRCDASGLFDDFVAPAQLTPKGRFLRLDTTNLAIDADTSAFEITDAHKNVTHFNLDGSLRFVRDRLGNTIVEYSYNARGQLTLITDPHGRETTLDYWDLTAGAYIAGKLKSITDFNGRIVQYDYYQPGDPNGSPGWLKTVTLPEASSLVKGQQQDYSRTETYQYNIDPNNRLNSQLAAVLDTNQNTWVSNEFDTVGRVDQQTRTLEVNSGTGTFIFEYNLLALPAPIASPPAPINALVTDRLSKQTAYAFSESPWPDAAAPSLIAIYGQTESHSHTRQYNQDGNLVHDIHGSTGSSGGMTVSTADEWQYVYDTAATTPERSRGNLLTTIQLSKGPNQQSRTTSFAYDPDFNLRVRTAGVRANSLQDSTPSVNSQIHARVHDYDSSGNLQSVTLPRIFNLVLEPDPNSPSQVKESWLKENPTVTYSYNAFGMVKTRTDARGVVTSYFYYPTDTPTNGTPDPDNGGLLANILFDTTATTLRADHMPDVAGGTMFPLANEQTSIQYNDLGDVSQVKDARGMITAVQVDALHRVTQIIRDTAGVGGKPALAITRNLTYNEFDQLVHAEFEQPSVTQLPPALQAQAGGTSLVDTWEYDPLGNPKSHTATLQQGQTVTETYAWDARYRLTDYKGFDAQTRFPGAGTHTDYGDRDLPSNAIDAQLESKYTWSPTRQIETFTDPARNVSTYTADDFGVNTGVTDPLKNTSTMLTDRGAAGTRHASKFAIPPLILVRAPAPAPPALIAAVAPVSGPQPAVATPAPTPVPAPVPSTISSTVTTLKVQEPQLGSQVEIRLDEIGRPCRFHQAGMVAIMPNASLVPQVPNQSQIEAPDYFPADAGWPAAQQIPALIEGPWGPRDLRWTRDLVYDGPLVTRDVDDEIRVGYTRYGSAGQVIEVRDADQNTTSYSYNEVNEVIGMVAVEQPTRVFSTPAVSAATYPSTIDRDAIGRATTTIDGEGNTWHYDYDETGYMRMVTDAKGNVTTYAKDGFGRTLQTQMQLTQGGIGGGAPDTNQFNPKGIAGYSAQYDEVGRILSYTDQASNQTRWTYDPDNGRYLSVTYAACAAANGQTTTSSVTYDPQSGLVQTSTDANGNLLTYSYDGLNRLENVVIGRLGNAGYQFAYNGPLMTVSDLQKTYSVQAMTDSGGRLGWLQQGKFLVTSQFDGTGRRVALNYSGGSVVTYEYDECGRLITVTDGTAVVATYDYLGRHGVLTRTQQSLVTTFTYSAGAGRLVGLSIGGLNGDKIDFALLRDPNGRITSLTRTSQAVGTPEQKVWQYDSAGRIVQETSRPSRSAPIITTRLFDGDSVLRQQTSPVAWTQTREERGRILSRNNTTYTYDLNGSLTNDGNQQYHYDAWNRLIQVTVGGQILATYAYDGLGRLITRTAGGTTEEYVYDKSWNLLEVWTQDAAGAWSLSERNVYGNAKDDLLCSEVNGEHFTYLVGPEGWLEAIINDQSQIIERYDYTLDGEVTVLNESGVVAGTPPKSRFLFQFRPYDQVTGLFNYRMRWYSPAIGQFLTPDSSGFADGSNHYGLNHGDPVNLRDPFGCEDQPSQPAPLQQAVPSGFVEEPPPSVNTGEPLLDWKLFAAMLLDGATNAPKEVANTMGDAAGTVMGLAGSAASAVWNWFATPSDPAPEVTHDVDDATNRILRVGERNEESRSNPGIEDLHLTRYRFDANVMMDSLEAVRDIQSAAGNGEIYLASSYVIAAADVGTKNLLGAGAPAHTPPAAEAVGSGGHHHMAVEVYRNESGKMVRIAENRFVSGGMSPGEIRPEDLVIGLVTREVSKEGKKIIVEDIKPGAVRMAASEAVHTERQAWRWLYGLAREGSLKKGDTVLFQGTLEPCPTCKRFANRFVESTGVKLGYLWAEEGTNPNKWTPISRRYERFPGPGGILGAYPGRR